MRLSILSWLVLISATSCSVAPVPRPVLPSVPLACQLLPPPEWQPVDAVMGGTGSCPAEMAVCLAAPGAASLARQLEAMFAWQEEAMLRCGPQPLPAPPAGSQSRSRAGRESRAAWIRATGQGVVSVSSWGER